MLYKYMSELRNKYNISQRITIYHDMKLQVYI